MPQQPTARPPIPPRDRFRQEDEEMHENNHRKDECEGNPCFTREIAPDRHRQNRCHPHFAEPEVVRLPGKDCEIFLSEMKGSSAFFGIFSQKREGGQSNLREPSPPHPLPKGHPLPFERQGGGGHALMKTRGSPLPIPFLGDDLKRVSDVNPCRKTGGGCHLGYLGRGAPGPGRVVVPDHPCPFLPGGG